MPSFFIVFLLCFAFINNLSEASHHRKLPSAVVVGTVYCDTCFQEDFSKNSHFISGASVSVECKDENSKPSFRREVKTDEHGEFKVHLPFSVSKHVRKIKRCSVKLLSSSEPYCAVASTATSSSLRLKSRKEGIHIFSAGFFSFKPQKQPNLCNQKPSIQTSREFNAQKTSTSSIPSFGDPAFPPPLQDPAVPDLPPLPLLPKLPPLPELPPLPPLPGLPNIPFPPVPSPPVPGKTTTNPKAYTESLKSAQALDQKEVNPDFFFPTPPLFPPNPFQPPPVLPPNPLQPPPLFPPLLPPNPFQPPPAPLIPLPPIPGLTPPPPPPTFPFPPLPPFPFPPSPPRVPGIPPASSTSQKTSP
ncbi:formin-2 [Manihot esculenta]|uniref:Pollen Ole e 1 allergen and extensin family protein n=1 Tax=Manihot esculenta TaxID=3983 RepID=A0A2C9WBC2_MANES|nr:formin-2 [Manihot esculenta]OAY56964.1 hypothetical protein MANES_02G059700v8 [Manihot esculenta]